MGERDQLVPDWRDAAGYAPLLHADRSLIAWEWLRRDPAYREAADRAARSGDDMAHGSGGPPGRWGLCRFEDPYRRVPAARPLWRTEVHPFVLGVEARPGKGADDFDLERVAAGSILVRGAGDREHLMISDGLHAVRIDVLAGSLARGPVELSYRLAGLASAERPLLTLRRLLALWRTGRFCRSVHAAEAKAGRWVLMLRAHDAVADGAGQREIAAELLGGRVVPKRWRVEESSVRSWVQRLVRSARSAADGGYRKLLL
ncbi:MAG TPA: DUF2285 domain-containing protein [Sphingomicrobium sp.]